MKVTLPRAVLKSALDGLARIVPKRTGLPVLQCVRLQLDHGILSLDATDLDQRLTWTIPVEGSGPDPVLVAFDDLKSLTDGNGNGQVTLSTSGKQLEAVRIIGETPLRTTFALQDVAEWPDLSEHIKTEPVEVSFLDQFRRVATFASRDETRGAIRGVLLETGKDVSHLVATDGRRLTAVSTGRLSLPTSCVVVPSKFLTWNRLGADQLGIGSGTAGDVTWFKLQGPDWTYSARTLEGTFPNWRNVIPTEKPVHGVEIAESDIPLVQQVVAGLRSDPNRTLRITAKRGQVTVGPAEASGNGTTVQLGASRSLGQALTCGVNGDFLQNALDAGFRKFGCLAPEAALTADDGNGAVHVLMPMRLKEPEPKIQQQPTREEKSDMKHEDNQPATATDKLVAAYEVARTKLREANEALAAIAMALKEATREEKQRRAELESARSGLAKLQAIRI